MRNEDIVKQIIAWQSNPLLHPLTCGNDSNHEVLVPVIEKKKVILRCLDCEYIQRWIPDVCMIDYIPSSLEELLKAEAKED
jgi:hypothetical protein